MIKYKPYILSVLLALSVGGISALLVAGNYELYDMVSMPPLSPPALVFPIVWSILYVLMGISAAMVFTDRNAAMTKKKTALKTYGISLILNFIWSIIFFNFGAFFIAFLVLTALLATIVKTILEYKDINLVAALLQLPYLVWVVFAGYLNIGTWILNG